MWSRLIAEPCLSPSSTPTTTSLGAPRIVEVIGATVTVGSTQQYIFFATGSDLLPTDNLGLLKAGFKLIGVLDTGASGTKTFELALPRAANRSSEEKPTVFPAVAGDIVLLQNDWPDQYQ